MKDEEVRLEQTIKFIGKTTHFPSALRTDVKAFAESYAGRATWATGKYVLPIAKKSGDHRRFSAEMTMTDVHTPGNDDQRAMRRAIFLLRSAMTDSLAAAKAKSMLVSRVKSEFVATMWKALCYHDENNGSDRGPRALYRELCERPVETLGWLRMQVLGSTRQDANTDTNRFDVVFRYNVSVDKFVFDPASRHNGGVGMCLVPLGTSVPALRWDTVPGRGTDAANGSFATIRGTHLAGTLMVTTQLTGCAVCIQDFGGTLCAAHIQPSDTLDGTVLAQQLAGRNRNVAGGGWSNAPVGAAGRFEVFGRGFSTLVGGAGGYDARLTDGRNRYCTVIGLARDGAWRLYAQEVLDEDIINARRIL